MPVIKTAISIEESLFQQAERIARKQNMSRSQFVAEALQQYITKQEDAELLSRLDIVYRDADSQTSPMSIAERDRLVAVYRSDIPE